MHDLHGIFMGYPFTLVARFDSDLAWLADMWEINWRGARLCAWETYFDTPYYEQLQYVGDTRIQALITLYMSDDDRLVRQAIEHFDLSRIPEGITASRYPSRPRAVIRPSRRSGSRWCTTTGCTVTTRVRARLASGDSRRSSSWFERRIDDTGMVGPISWWQFVDWARGWERGVPPGGDEGHSTVISLQFVYALERAAELEKRLGVPGAGRPLPQRRAEGARCRARRVPGTRRRRLFRDAPDGDTRTASRRT